jgi:hypothetical protein
LNFFAALTFLMMHQGTQAVKAVNRQFWNRSKGAAVLPAACSEDSRPIYKRGIHAIVVKTMLMGCNINEIASSNCPGKRFLISKFLITKFLITLFLITVFLSKKVPKLQNS